MFDHRYRKEIAVAGQFVLNHVENVGVKRQCLEKLKNKLRRSTIASYFALISQLLVTKLPTPPLRLLLEVWYHSTVV